MTKITAFIASERKLLEAATPGPAESLEHWNQLYWLRMGFLDSISILQKVDSDGYKMAISLLDSYLERNLPKLESPYKTTRSVRTSHVQALDALEIAMEGLRCGNGPPFNKTNCSCGGCLAKQRIEKLVEKKS